MRYSIVLIHEGDDVGYGVEVPMLPGCFSQGDTLDEAVAMAREAIELHLRGHLADGEPIPVEDKPAILVQVDVDLPALSGARTAVFE